MIQLRSYQQEAIQAVLEAGRRGIRRQVLSMATGSGKTCVATELASKMPRRTLFLCHRDELIRQTVTKFHDMAPDLQVGVVKAGENEVDAHVVVGSVQTLMRPNRLSQLDGDDFGLVIADECHHSTAESWRRVLEHVGTFRTPRPTLTIGLSATPERADGTGLDEIFDEIVYTYDILRGIREGTLCDLRGQIVGTDLDLSRVRTRGGDFAEGELGTELVRSGALDEIADAWLTHAADRKTLAFTPTVDTAHGLAASLRARGVAAEAFDGSTPTDDRRGVLRRFHTGETQVLANCAVLTEGFDEPSADCILLARPTKSAPLYRQIVGRGARTYPGKSDCLVLDVTGVSADTDLAGLHTLAGLERAEVADGDSVTEAVERAESPSGRKAQIRRAQRSQTVDLFARSRLRWLQLDGALILPAGPVTVLLIPLVEEDDDRAMVVALRRGGRVEVLAENTSYRLAEGIGEDFARQCGSLSRTDASWRKKRPSEKQTQLLAGHGIDVTRVRDSGHASDLIAQISARQAIRRIMRDARPVSA